MKRSEAFLKVSEQLIELVAECGIETEDTPYIQRRAATPPRRSRAARGRAAHRHDQRGAPVRRKLPADPGTNPPQHLTRFIDARRPAVPAGAGAHADAERRRWCSASRPTATATSPTHNRKYNQPQRGDLAWDTANSRYRRIFNDRTGLASARNERPFLLQTYRRDMGGGNFVVMKEAAAPITVNGRHWGGLRLAFKF